MEEPNVSVAILSAEQIKFELYGDIGSILSDKALRGKYTAKFTNGKIEISDAKEVFFEAEEVLFEPEDLETDSFIIYDVVIGKNFHWEQKEKQRFLGSLRLIVENDKLTAINILPMEYYLTSVISSEMSATSSVELLKAHAIISRSWLLSQMLKEKETAVSETEVNSKIESKDERITWYDRKDHTLYDVCADDHCQRYQGITRLHAHNAQEAVMATSGIVLKYKDEVCDTRYSKCCGGISESYENVWDPNVHPYLTKVVDYKFDPDDYNINLTKEEVAEEWILHNPPAFCNTNDRKVLTQVLVSFDQKTADFYRWEVSYTQKEISELIHEKSGIDFGEIIDLVPVERGLSGRIIKLKIVGTKKTFTIGKELEIRKILSKSHLYSSALVFKKKEIVDGIPQQFILKGAGWGHGVGLCQIGAAVMGEMGYLFDEILVHYFPGVKIQKIY